MEGKRLVGVRPSHRVQFVFCQQAMVCASSIALLSCEHTATASSVRSIYLGILLEEDKPNEPVVNRFLFLRDMTDPFVRTVCQLRLGKALPEFVVSSAGPCARAIMVTCARWCRPHIF